MILNRHSAQLSANRRRRGSVLAISLIVVMVIASLGAGLIQMHSAIARRQLQAIDNKRALYIAEAGLSEAFMAIAHGKSGQIGSEDKPAIFGNGLFWVEVAELADKSIAIVSNGLCETGRFSLAMTVKREVSPIASLGLFGAESVTIGEGTIIDGYDSQAGTFASQVDPALGQGTTGEGARITSNSEILIASSPPAQVDGMGIGGAADPGRAPVTYSTWVFGDATPGPGAGVLADPGVLVTGDTMPALRAITIEALTPPGGLGGATVLNHMAPGTLVLSNVQNQYRKIHVGRRSELVLEGPVTLMAAGLTLEPGAQLTIDTTGGPVMLYVTSYINLSAGSTLVNTSQDPTQVALVIGATELDIDIDGDGSVEPTVTLEADGEFFGMLYAPTAVLTIPEGLRLYGCLAGKTVAFADGAHFSYDRAMTTNGVAVSGLPGLLSWRIVELPTAAIVRRRRDPMRALQLAGVTPVPSHEAYVESFVHVDYTDNGGVPRVYEGLETAMNWNAVKKVDNLRWANGIIGLSTAPNSSANGKATPATDF